MSTPDTTPASAPASVCRLDGKVAFVTGASRGIGRAIALALADAGAALVPAARSVEALEKLADEIRDAGGAAEPVVLDVTDPGGVAEAVAAARQTFGRLDVVVNNAGGVPFYGRTEQMDVAQWDATVDVNLRSVFLVCRAAAPLLFEDGGSVVNISSIDGVAGMRQMAAYCAAKAGVIALTKALAAEWAERDVRVNCVCPGAVATEMTASLRDERESRFHRHLMAHTPQARFAAPEEIAGAVVYLASDAASFTTGAILAVDGGFSAV